MQELCISKCLHQQHAYGWHTYKLRNYGIEVIPSVHKILYRRNYMDNAVPEALLPISRPSYRYWLEESVGESKIYDITDNDSRTENNCIANLRKNYYELYDLRKGKDDLYETIEQGCIKVFFGKKEDPDEPIRAILSNIYEKSKMYDHHVLFIDFSRSRKDFWKIINKFKYTGRSENIHFFGIRYGCL